jgi:hypothetical protein
MPQMTHATRKQVYDLTLADFNAVPVWEFASDEEDVPGQDEATVRPYIVTPIDPGHGGLIVHAIFTLADGTHLRVYLSPQPTSLRKPVYIQPVIISEAGQINFWSGIRRPTPSKMMEALEKLDKHTAQVFPLK